MNDEIKEINIKIPGQILDYVDTKDHLLDLFDYITNLQQENERKERLITQYGEGMCAYANRIDKAIEYINTHDDSFYQEKGLNEDSLNNLLNILQNGSEKE